MAFSIVLFRGAPTPLIRRVFSVALLVSVPAFVAMTACGSDPPSCDDICAPNPPACVPSSDCSQSCNDYGTACTAAPGDFQALVTCIANSGEACNGFATIPTLCQPFETAVEKFCGQIQPP